MTQNLLAIPPELIGLERTPNKRRGVNKKNLKSTSSTENKSVAKIINPSEVNQLNLNNNQTNFSSIPTTIIQPYQQYLDYIKLQKNFSSNTIKSYQFTLLQAIYIWLDYSNQQQLNWNEWKLLNLSMLNHYIEQLYHKQLKKQSIRIRCTIINSFLTYLLKQQIIITNPYKRVSKLKIAPRSAPFVAVDAINKLINSFANSSNKIDKTWYCLLETMFSTGLRVSEITNLLVGDINLEQRQIMVLGKGRKGRIVPITKHLAQLLAEHIVSLKNQQLLFELDHKPITRFMIDGKIKRRCKNLAIEPLSAHKLRHCYATQILINSKNIRLVQQLLGHSQIHTTQIYTSLDIDYLLDNYNQFHPLAQERTKLDKQTATQENQVEVNKK